MFSRALDTKYILNCCLGEKCFGLTLDRIFFIQLKKILQTTFYAPVRTKCSSCIVHTCADSKISTPFE